MLFCAKADAAAVQTADAGKIRLGGGVRPCRHICHLRVGRHGSGTSRGAPSKT